MPHRHKSNKYAANMQATLCNMSIKCTKIYTDMLNAQNAFKMYLSTMINQNNPKLLIHVWYKALMDQVSTKINPVWRNLANALRSSFQWFTNTNYLHALLICYFVIFWQSWWKEIIFYYMDTSIITFKTLVSITFMSVKTYTWWKFLKDNTHMDG